MDQARGVSLPHTHTHTYTHTHTQLLLQCISTVQPGRHVTDQVCACLACTCPLLLHCGRYLPNSVLPSCQGVHSQISAQAANQTCCLHHPACQSGLIGCSYSALDEGKVVVFPQHNPRPLSLKEVDYSDISFLPFCVLLVLRILLNRLGRWRKGSPLPPRPAHIHRHIDYGCNSILWGSSSINEA